MKKIKSIFGLALLGSLLFHSCNADDNTIFDDGSGILPCDAFKKDLLVLSTHFDDDPNAIINYNSFLINDLDSSQPNVEGLFTTNTNMTFQLPTSTSFYNEASNLHGILVNRAGKYFTFKTNTSVGQEFAVPNSVTAPLVLNNSGYVIEPANSGYPDQGIGNHYDIKPFNINNGVIGSALPIDPIDKTFDNSSFFLVESISGATNGIDKLFYLSGTNLLTINTANNTASHTDLYPSFSYSDFVRFFGLEYSETLGLIAVMDDATQDVQSIVQIDHSGNITPLLTITDRINSEFYSTTFRECDQTYFLTSLNQGSNPIETLYFEFDLTTNTLGNSQIFQDYAFGIELIPQ